MVVCTCESSLLCRDVCLMPRTKFGSDTMLEIFVWCQERSFGSDTMLNISIEMCYTMLCMLEWMRKRKYRRGILRTRGLRGSALTARVTDMSIYRRLNPKFPVLQ